MMLRAMLKKSTFLLGIISVLIISTSCRHQAIEEDDNPFSGLWKLHIMEQKDSITGEWNEWRNGMQGYILYDNQDHMSVHLTTRGYENTPLSFPNFSDTIAIEALKHLTKSYVYFARYTIHENEQYVEHARISHSNPADWNMVVRRKYHFTGDTLVLQPMEENNSGLRLKWIKTNDTLNPE